MRTKLIFLFIVTAQIGIIFYLIRAIREKNRVLGYHYNPIFQEDILFPENEGSTLKFFYEPEAGTVKTDNFDWLPQKITYTINSDSLNDRFTYTIQKPENTFRIITFGDSFTFGSYVETKHNYPETLENKLNSTCSQKKSEVINLGYGGYDIDYSVERYRLRGVKYQPDLVLWLISIWNFNKINEEIFPRMQEIIDEATKSGTFDKQLKEEGQYFMWERASEELVSKYGPSLAEIQFNKFKKIRSFYSGKLVIIVFRDQIAEDSTGQGYSAFVEKIKNLDNKTYVYSDIAYEDLETLGYDPHPDEKDYKFMVDNITNYLINNNLFSCN